MIRKITTSNIFLAAILVNFQLSICFSQLNNTLIPINNSYEYGYVNEKNELVINKKFSSARPFSEGLAAVGVHVENKYSDKIGYINKKGEMVIPPTFERAQEFRNGFAKVAIRDKSGRDYWGIIDKNGDTIVDFVYYDITSIRGNVAVGRTADFNYVLLDLEKKEKIGGEFAYIKPYQCAYTVGRQIIDNSIYIIDDKGKLTKVDGFKYQIEGFNEFGFSLVFYDNEWGVINHKLEFIVPCEFTELECSRSRCYGRAKGQQFIIDLISGKKVNTKYDLVEDLDDFYSKVELNGKIGIIDRNENTILPLKFDFFRSEGNFYIVGQNNLFGLIDLNGNQIVPCLYKDFSFEPNNLIYAELSEDLGNFIVIYDSEGNELLGPKYNSIDDFINKRAIVYIYKTRKYGIIDLNMNLLTPVSYDHIYYSTSDNNFEFRKGNVKGKLDINGK